MAIFMTTTMMMMVEVDFFDNNDCQYRPLSFIETWLKMHFWCTWIMSLGRNWPVKSVRRYYFRAKNLFRIFNNFKQWTKRGGNFSIFPFLGWKPGHNSKQTICCLYGERPRYGFELLAVPSQVYRLPITARNQQMLTRNQRHPERERDSRGLSLWDNINIHKDYSIKSDSICNSCNLSPHQAVVSKICYWCLRVASPALKNCTD